MTTKPCELASRSQSEDLGKESLVQGGETLLSHDSADGGPGPVVLGSLASNAGAVLNARLRLLVRFCQ